MAGGARSRGACARFWRACLVRGAGGAKVYSGANAVNDMRRRVTVQRSTSKQPNLFLLTEGVPLNNSFSTSKQPLSLPIANTSMARAPVYGAGRSVALLFVCWLALVTDARPVGVCLGRLRGGGVAGADKASCVLCAQRAGAYAAPGFSFTYCAWPGAPAGAACHQTA